MDGLESRGRGDESRGKEEGRSGVVAAAATAAAAPAAMLLMLMLMLRLMLLLILLLLTAGCFCTKNMLLAFKRWTGFLWPRQVKDKQEAGRAPQQ